MRQIPEPALTGTDGRLLQCSYTHLLRVNDHTPLVIQLDASVFKAHAVRDWRATDCNKHTVEIIHRLTGGKSGVQLAVATLFDTDDLRVGDQLSARADDLRVEDLLNHWVEAVPQDTCTPACEGNFAAKRLENA
eukprot:scaffold35022_cov33-Tisochrysis_lutea.AAC.5